MTTQSQCIVVSGTVGASAAAVFAFLADPGNHVALDTSGMVRGAATTAPIDRIGAVFVMHMDGAHDRTENHVVVHEPDRAIGWAPAAPGCDPAGHTWTWRMVPLDEHRATVSLTYDWSGCTDPEALPYLPLLNEEQLRASLDRLIDAVRPG